MSTNNKTKIKHKIEPSEKNTPNETDKQFHALADNMPNLAWIADPEGWIYWYNSRWFEYTGTVPEDMKGWGWKSVHDPKELPIVLKKWEKSIKSGKPFEMVFPIKRHDGVFKPFLTRVIPLKDSKGKVIRWFGTNTDISSQEAANTLLSQAKIEAEQAKQRLTQLFTQAPAMIAVLKGPDLVFELANPLYLLSVGKSEDIIGKPLLKVFPELKDQEILGIVKTVLETGEPYEGKEIMVKLDKNNNGKLKDIYFTFVYQPIRDEQGVVNGVMTHAVDVSSHVLARQKLEDSEAQFRFMAESLPQKIFTTNPKGQVIYFNPQWEEYTGLNMKQIELNGAKVFVHPDDIDNNMKSWEKALNEGITMQSYQRLLRSDGQYRRHVSHVRPMKNEDGKIIRWFGSMTDIEDVMTAVENKERLEHKAVTLRKQKAELIAINHAKDEFISLASHQLRTPATSVKQYIGMILEGYVGEISKELREFLHRAYDGNERQLKIIDDLLKVALIDAGKVKPKFTKIEIVRFVKEVTEDQNNRLINKNQKISFIPCVEPCEVNADTSLVRMALDNIIDNASKYSYEGKPIKVQIKRLNKNVNIIIKDEGVGIPEAEIGKLFRKFSRVDNPLSVSSGGNGLGLYWAKKVIELHNGSVNVTSKVNKGSTFKVMLPV